MQDIQTMGFQRHPCVMPSMTNFLFHRRAPTSKVDALEKVVKDLQAESRALKSSNDSLRDSVKKLEAKVKK
jgi:polyhydroxyalkanoate synthesis regulator phasin